MITYKTVESNTKPLEIDLSSSASGVYVRRNIEKIITIDEDTQEERIKYQYQEAFLSLSEYETYSTGRIVGEINGEENTAEFEEYKKNLNTPIPYSNGKTYKPTWADIYAGKVEEIYPMVMMYEKVGGDTSKILSLKIAIYDSSAKVENAVLMSVKEIIELWFFLLTKQEELFNLYKASLDK